MRNTYPALLLCLATVPAAARGTLVQPLSFPDFELQQNRYCQELARTLSSPIEWRLVVDVSPSYKDGIPNLPETAARILRGLPLQPGDSLVVDSFASTYSQGDGPGRLDAHWIRDLHSGNSSSQGAIESWLPDIRADAVDQYTDLERLPAALAATLSESTAPAHTYFVVLTDGKNVPPGRRALPSLFGHQSAHQCIGEQLVGLGGSPVLGSDRPSQSLVGSLFVIDTRFLSPANAVAVVREWAKVGQPDLRRHLDGATPRRQPAPEIVIWRAVGEEELVGDANRWALARKDVLIPCVESRPSPSHSRPAAPDRPLPQPPKPLRACLRAEGGCPLSIPRESLFGDYQERSLALTLLARGPATRTLFVTVRSEPHGPAHTRRFELTPPDVGSAGWRTYNWPLDFTFDEATLALRPFPWQVELAFDDVGNPPFLKLSLNGGLAASIWSMIPVSFHEGTRSVPRRGRAFAILAGACALLSWWLTKWRTAGLRVEVTLESAQPSLAGGPYPCAYREIHLRCAFTERQLRSSLRREPAAERLWQQVFRRDGPTVGRHDVKLELDVIPLFGMVYHVVYYLDPGGLLRLGDEQRISFRRFDASLKAQDITGLFFLPSTFWRHAPPRVSGSELKDPEPKDSVATATAPPRALRVLAGLQRWLQAPLEWSNDIPLPVTATTTRQPVILGPDGRPLPPMSDPEAPRGATKVTVTTRLLSRHASTSQAVSADQFPVRTQLARVVRELWKTTGPRFAVVLSTDLAVAFAVVAIIRSMNLERLDHWGQSAVDVALILAGIFAVRLLVHHSTFRGWRPRERRWAKFCGSVLVVATILLGIFLPFATSAPAPVRWLIATLMVGTCVGVAVGTHRLVLLRVRAQRPLDGWDLIIEWFMRISPIVF